MVQLESKKGLHITKCLKYFLPLDNDHIPASLRDQESDGRVLLSFSDGSIFLLYGITEDFSLQIEDTMDSCPNDVSAFTDISKNKFWTEFINQKIVDLLELKFDNSAELVRYGIRITVEGKKSFEVTYESRTAFDFDTTVIRAYPNINGE